MTAPLTRRTDNVRGRAEFAGLDAASKRAVVDCLDHDAAITPEQPDQRRAFDSRDWFVERTPAFIRGFCEAARLWGSR